MISRMIIGVVLLFGILLLSLPKRDEDSLAKIASTSMLMCTLDFRERVARQVIRGEPVDSEFRNKCPDLIAALEVSQRGKMVISGKQHQVKLTLSPVVEGNTIRWSCQGEPAAAVTKLCKL
ncbi:hypothetical protein [Thiohalomonas denitrificans]|uniref:Uncharacterized protein n=1 Tax=Thiohalomonas denitrificans TaxID=415747 RepID=A0A1G5QYD8_9GAMM|nr:hypothetical protein [Thiohalomonas denitrificans]SCZ66823.1 hypothetical protein SAMN03097708_03025 [Thiohalomonas denitrificans]